MLTAGDWVRVPALWPGIWRVYRVLSGFKEDRWSLDDPLRPSQRTIVFCHRLVNDSWKRSFSHQSCEGSLTHPVARAERDRIGMLLSSDKKLAAAFKKYQDTVKSIDLVANLGFGEFSEQESKEFPNRCAALLGERIDGGLTMDEVLSILQENELAAHQHKSPKQATLQLISPNHELKGDRFVYRRYGTLAF